MTKHGTVTSEYRHIPVMLDEAVSALSLPDHPIYVDATLGMGGHAAACARKLGSHGMLIGIDQDDLALERAAMKLEHIDAADRPEIVILKGNFGELDELLMSIPVPRIDAILFDLGVSSPQIDNTDRGFSFKENAPLDMRMDPGKQTITAAEIINTSTAADLSRIIRINSDEKWASRIADFIVAARQVHRIETSGELVEIIKNAIPASARRSGGHPAKRTFQALRMEVNSEQAVLRRGLEAAIRWLSPGGVICAISYHSIEDRIVKETFSAFANRCTCPPDLPVCACGKEPILDITTKRPLTPSAAEIENNPRARSAKMRIAHKR